MRMSTTLHPEELLMDLQEALAKGELAPKRNRVFSTMPAYMEADLNESLKKSQEVLKPLPNTQPNIHVPFAI